MTDPIIEVISWDPGYITGVAHGVFTKTKPLQLVDTGAFVYDEVKDNFDLIRAEGRFYDHSVIERFDLRSGNEFTADLTGKKVEGILEVAFGDRVRWRTPADKTQVSDDLLRNMGWWMTGSDVEWEDGRDVNDALIHLLGFVAFDLKHVPTLREYFR